MNIYQFVLILFSIITACQIQSRSEEIAPENLTFNTALSVGNRVHGAIESVGASSASFIPSKPTALAGFGGIKRRFFPPLFSPRGEVSFCRPYEDVIDPPKIKVAALAIREKGGNSRNVYLVSLDLVAVTADLTKSIHSAINEVVGSDDASLNNTVVLASHTHSGPAGLTQNPLWGAFVCDQYNHSLRESYINSFKSTLKEALTQSVPISEIETLAIDNHDFTKTRFEGMNMEKKISLLSFKSKQGEIPLALLRLGVHPTTYGQSDLILSADLVASLEKATESAFNAQHVFLVQTEVGNMDSNLSNKSTADWANEVANSLKQTSTLSSSTSLNFTSYASVLDLPEKEINWKGCNAQNIEPFISVELLKKLPSTTPFTIWNIDQDFNAFLAGEWTTSGADILKSALQKKINATQSINIISLANDYTAYHLSPPFYDSKNIESCSSIYGKNGVEKISLKISELTDLF